MECMYFFEPRYKSTYDPYKYLLTREVDKYFDKFVNKERTLREYVKEIEKLKRMASEIASLPVFIPMHLFLLDCTNFNQVKNHLKSGVEKQLLYY